MHDQRVVAGDDGLAPDAAQALLELRERERRRRSEVEIGLEIGKQASIGRARDGVRMFTASILDGWLRVSVRRAASVTMNAMARVCGGESRPTSVTAIRSPDIAATRTSRPSSISANMRKGSTVVRGSARNSETDTLSSD